MSRVLRRLITTYVDTAVPVAAPAKALTVGTRASGETSKASLAQLKEPTRGQPLSNVYINVCIRDEHENIWEHAEKLVGEARTSRPITEALRADVSSRRVIQWSDRASNTRIARPASC